MKKGIGFCFAVAALTACNTVDQSKISTVPAAESQIAAATKAAEVCGRHAPDWGAAKATLQRTGYSETTDPALKRSGRSNGSIFLRDSASDVVVQIGQRGKEGACIVGLPGMTPEQASRLAQPWVAKFDLKTNAERGQGLAQSAQQAWGGVGADRIIYVAAYKTWDAFDGPGAAARLLYIQR